MSFLSWVPVRPYFIAKQQLQLGVAPPSADELASLLADKIPVPAQPMEFQRIREDLSRVASVFEHLRFDRVLLNNELKAIFDRDFAPNILHITLVAIAARSGRPFLIITTNYDDMIERAFDDAKLPYHLLITSVQESLLVNYKAAGESDFEQVDPSQLKRIPQNAPIIYKMHGSVERGDGTDDGSYVITEEDYLTFLTNTVAVPAVISAMFVNRRFLFLSYSLRDWNFRVMLNHRLQEKRQVRSWGIQFQPNDIDRRLWERKQVDIFDMDLHDFSKQLAETLASKPSE